MFLGKQVTEIWLEFKRLRIGYPSRSLRKDFRLFQNVIMPRIPYINERHIPFFRCLYEKSGELCGPIPINLMSKSSSHRRTQQRATKFTFIYV
jgi:hypothetical protein